MHVTQLLLRLHLVFWCLAFAVTATSAAGIVRRLPAKRGRGPSVGDVARAVAALSPRQQVAAAQIIRAMAKRSSRTLVFTGSVCLALEAVRVIGRDYALEALDGYEEAGA